MALPSRKPRDVSDLTVEEDAALRVALDRLKHLAREYSDKYRAQELKPGHDVEPFAYEDLARDTQRLQEAEQEYYRLRYELLGWVPATRAFSVFKVPEWFSEEDEIYDGIDVE